MNSLNLNKEKSENNKKKLISLVIGFSTAIAGLATLLKNLEPIQNQVNQLFGDGSAITTYTRLNGAYQVPSLMFKNSYFQFEGRTNVVLIDYKKTFEYWQTGKLVNATFGVGPVGEEINVAFDSYMNHPTSLNDPITNMTFSSSDLILQFKFLDYSIPKFELSEDKQERVIESLGYSYPEYSENIIDIQEIKEKIHSNLQYEINNIGYLFFTIQNKSDSLALEDVEMSYTIFRNTFGNCIETSDKIIPKGLAFEENLHLKLPRIEKNQIYLLPIATYRSDNNKYPKEFCSSVIVPSKITWSESGSRKSKKISPPSLNDSAHETIPLGWWQQ